MPTSVPTIKRARARAGLLVLIGLRLRYWAARKLIRLSLWLSGIAMRWMGL